MSEWDIRRLYNEGSIKKLAKQGKLQTRRKFGTPKKFTKRIPPGSRSVGVYYYDMAGLLIAYFHHYEFNGKVIGRFDPKFLRIHGTEYRLPARGEPEPKRVGNVEINRILDKRGLKAKITYLYHLSEQVQKLWKEQVTQRLVRWNIIESREWLLTFLVSH